MLIRKHKTRISTEQTSMKTKWFKTYRDLNCLGASPKFCRSQKFTRHRIFQGTIQPHNIAHLGIVGSFCRYVVSTRGLCILCLPLFLVVITLRDSNSFVHELQHLPVLSACVPLCCKNLCCASRFGTGGGGAAGSRSKQMFKGR